MVITSELTPVDDISSFFPNERNIKVSMLRLDKLHPVISGNKYFKLKYNLEAAVEGGFKQVLTFGGAYSNHLVATAAAARLRGLKSIGIVRGFHARAQLSPTLEACADEGMHLHFVSREDYARKSEADFINELPAQFRVAFVIPEGGDNDLGRKGTGEIAEIIPDEATHVCVSIGTGTTFVGIRDGLDPARKMIGFPAVKDGGYLKEEIEQHLEEKQNKNWYLEDRFHFGGFAKTNPDLLKFMRSFFNHTGIPLDIVYTGKMMYGVNELIKEGVFPDNACIIAIHTGGLQGNPAGLYQL